MPRALTEQEVENGIAHAAFALRYHELRGDAHPAKLAQLRMQLDRCLVLYERVRVGLGFRHEPTMKALVDALGYPTEAGEVQ
jgi:hypothetical protein